eukprot:TRINITY_DN35704_c0_g1_i1.p1 TRINITY_DN35704_c0_g1~~TRINITY_DN35704_c0_g1_i1.p1  ORF type:complete len:636 (-),score=73.68 TRINITY_DN35704_c0_g1_i1:67-1974(-)
MTAAVAPEMAIASRGQRALPVNLEKDVISRLDSQIRNWISKLEPNQTSEAKTCFEVPDALDETHFMAYAKRQKHLNCLILEFIEGPAGRSSLQVRVPHRARALHSSNRRSGSKSAGYLNRLPDDLKEFVDWEGEAKRDRVHAMQSVRERSPQPLQPPTRSVHALEPTLTCIVAVLMGLPADEEMAIQETIKAFGGQVLPTDRAQDATHIIVSPKLRTLKVAQDKHKILLPSWVEELIEQGADPRDDALARKHAASNLVCTGSAENSQKCRRTVNQRPSGDSQGPSIGSSSTMARGSSQQQMRSSLSETLAYLQRERPGELEAGQIRLAIERSLMDAAVELHRAVPEVLNSVENSEPSPAHVLGLSEGACSAEIRRAYRVKALAAHPDKGGDPAEFCRVRRAYLTLSGQTLAEGGGGGGERLALPTSGGGACKDFQLRNHRELVKQKFKEDGVNLEDCARRQTAALRELDLTAKDVGATNRNEQGETIFNQCFYLSVARSYSDENCNETVRDTALSLKRVVEAAVLAEHPDWAGERVGEDVQAFSDFLVFVLGTNALLSELSVAIFDEATGGVEVYVGRCFPGRGREDDQRPNLLTILYLPGHYQALIPRSGRRPSFKELRHCLERHNVHHVITYV